MAGNPDKLSKPRGTGDDVLATAHTLAAALHRVNALDAIGMPDMDRHFPQPRRTMVAGHAAPQVREPHERAGLRLASTATTNQKFVPIS